MSKSNGRKQESVLGLSTIEIPQPLHTELVPFAQPNRDLTREEKRITEEFNRRTLIIEAEGEITRYGITAIGEIRDHASFVFHDTVVSILDRQHEVRGEECEPYVVEFNRLNIQGGARDLLALAVIGPKNIGEIVYKSLDLPPEQLSWWKRTFG